MPLSIAFSRSDTSSLSVITKYCSSHSRRQRIPASSCIHLSSSEVFSWSLRRRCTPRSLITAQSLCMRQFAVTQQTNNTPQPLLQYNRRSSILLIFYPLYTPPFYPRYNDSIRSCDRTRKPCGFEQSTSTAFRRLRPKHQFTAALRARGDTALFSASFPSKFILTFADPIFFTSGPGFLSTVRDAAHLRT